MMADATPSLSVEFSHIYTDEEYNDEHRKSAVLLSSSEIAVLGAPRQHCVLVDDYNPSRHVLDVPGFLAELQADGTRIDYFAYESTMQMHAERLLADITDGRTRRSFERYIANKGKLPCSFMTAIWYLVRLGLYEPDGIIHCLPGAQFNAADRLVNILPERFRQVEKQTLNLLSGCDGVRAAERIDAVFH